MEYSAVSRYGISKSDNQIIATVVEETLMAPEPGVLLGDMGTS